MEDLMDIAYLAFVVALVIIVFHNQKKRTMVLHQHNQFDIRVLIYEKTKLKEDLFFLRVNTIDKIEKGHELKSFQFTEILKCIEVIETKGNTVNGIEYYAQKLYFKPIN